MKGYCRKYFWTGCFLAGFIFLNMDIVFAQDVYVKWVTVTPETGQAGDTVSLEARIGNNGPGMALAIQVQWFISNDPEITPEDMVLGDVETLSQILYSGDELTITKEIVLPFFEDLDPPSYLGLMLDPYVFLSDSNRINNRDSVSFTLIGSPPGYGFFDSMGDHYLDITHVSAMIAGENLEVSITFRTPPTGSISGIMSIDLDQNPKTSAGFSSIPGAEALASFIYQEFAPALSLQTVSGTTSLSTLDLAGNSLVYTIPLSLLGNDFAMDLFWAADIALGVTSDFDRAPDIGVFATDTNEVMLRFTGDATVRADMPDPITGPGEPEFPNVKRVEAEVVGDTLKLVLTYNHPVENLGLNPGDEGLFVWIGIDADHSLCTGFANTEQQPPAFGVDYEFRLQIDPLAGIVAELLTDNDRDGEAEVIPMGLPVNDMFMRLSNDQIICRIPLSYLGFHDGSGALIVTNLNTRELLTGTVDMAPDTGAWDFKTDAPLSGQTCSTAISHYDDPADDSIGAFGFDNDELIGLDLCMGANALLFSIDYKSYALSNDGVTLIYFDTDRNPATGWDIMNLAEDTHIGAEYVIRTYWNTELLKQITSLYKCLPPEQIYVKNQLTTITRANRLYLSVPFECINNPASGTDILLRTASWAGGGSSILLPNDDLPNHGILRFSANVCECNLNNDTTCDMQDWLVFGEDWGRTDCNDPGVDCECDLTGDGNCDMQDWLLFGEDWGRNDCP